MSSKGETSEQASDQRGVVTLTALWGVHARAVFAVCLANTQNYHDAEDVMQSVFLKASEKISDLRDFDRARAWLLQVARRASIDHHRRKKPAQPLSDEPATINRNMRFERLHAAVQALPKHYREVITLYYMDDRSCSSVASSTGCTEHAVRQRLVRARAMLHDLLREDQT